MQQSALIAAYRRKPSCVARQNVLSILHYQAPVEPKALEAFDLSDYIPQVAAADDLMPVVLSSKIMQHIIGLTGALPVLLEYFDAWAVPRPIGTPLSIGDGAMLPDITKPRTLSQPVEISDCSLITTNYPTHCLGTLHWLVSADKARASLCARHSVSISCRAQANL